MRTFLIICFGQLVSMIGSGLTGFALGVWVYRQTGSVTHFMLISLFAKLPEILISPLAGVITDRLNRRLVMILSDSGAAVCTLILATLYWTDSLTLWHIYTINAATSCFTAFQYPAYTSATSLIVPREKLGKASGLSQVAEASAQLASPIMAGALMEIIGLHGVFLIDAATFLFALVTLLVTRIPDAKTSANGFEKKSLLREAAFGWRYIVKRRGLVAMLVFFAINNFLMGMAEALATPLVLSFGSPMLLGAMLSVGGAGMLAGSLAMSVWGGPKRLILGVFAFDFLTGLCILSLGLHTVIPLMCVSVFLLFFGLPIANGCTRVIWQKKVDPEVQGRVFAINRMIMLSSLPLAYLVSGPLSDYLFEPLMADGGALAGSVGRVIGVGPGRGIALMYVILGAATILTTTTAFKYPRLVMIEDELPNFWEKE